jgi:hypothetical protein
MFTTRKHGNTEARHICGSLEVQLPEFDPAADFTISGWVKSAGQSGNAVILSMVCAEIDRALVAIGEWDKAGHLQVMRAWSCSVPQKLEHVWLVDKANARLECTWQHIAYTQTREHMLYFMNGRLIVSAAASRLPHAPATQVRWSLRRDVAFAEPVARSNCALAAAVGPAASLLISGMAKLKVSSYGRGL